MAKKTKKETKVEEVQETKSNVEQLQNKQDVYQLNKKPNFQ